MTERKSPRWLDKDALSRLDEFVLIPDFVSLSGSTVYGEQYPNDLDCILRGKLSSGEITVELDDSILMKLRKALGALKPDLNVHLVPTPYGPNYTYVPLADLVVRPRREIALRNLDGEHLAAKGTYESEAAVSARENTIRPMRFFPLPKPVRPIKPEERMTVEALLSYTEKLGKVQIEKKYDGVHVLAMLFGEKVKLVTEDREECTERLPSIVAALRQLSVRSASFDCELEYWKGDEHQPREYAAAYLHRHSKPDDTGFVLNVFGVLFLDGNDLHKRPEAERRALLEKVKWPQSTIEIPSLPLNLVPSLVGDTPASTKAAVEKCLKASGSEGVVVKKMDASFPLSERHQGWLKYHKNVAFTAVVLERVETAAPGVYNYVYGVLPGKLKVANEEKVGENTYTKVGKTFSTARKLEAGEHAEIEAEGINITTRGDRIAVTAWVPRFIAKTDGAVVAADELMESAKREGVLTEKKLSEVAKEVKYPPESSRHSFVVQSHWRGKSIHLDLRLGIDGYLEGWTLMPALPGRVNEDISTLGKAKEADRKTEWYKWDILKGEPKERQVRGGQVRPASLMAAPKAKHPTQWLSVEGAGDAGAVGGTRRHPGVFHILDRGQVEYGTQKPYFREYFLSGKRWRGRYLARLLSHKGEVLPPGEEADDHGRAPFYWLFMKAVNNVPYVLSREAVKKSWLPPRGTSALPSRIRKLVPDELRYWEVSGAEALKRREELSKQEWATKGIRQVFASSGGKKSLAPSIARLIPKHRVYVEPFAGGASVFFAKPPSQVEVLSDKNEEVARAYRVLSSLTEEGRTRLEKMNWNFSEEQLRKANAVARDNDDLVRFWSWMIRVNCAYGADLDAEGKPAFSRIPKNRTGWKGVSRLKAIHERLKEVKVHCADYKVLVEKYDGEDAFFYFDPPYTGKAHAGIGKVSHVELLRVLRGMKGKFILSVANTAENRELFHQFHQRKVKRGALSIDYRKQPNEMKMSELLVCNFTPAAKEEETATLYRRWWKGQQVIRFGPSTQVWDIVVKGKFHFILDGDPRKTEYGNAFLSTLPIPEKVEGVQEIPPQSALNPEKTTQEWIEKVEESEVEVLEDGEDVKKVTFSGKGELLFAREEPKSEVWTFSRTRKLSFKMCLKQEDEHIVGGIVYPAFLVDAQGEWSSPEANKEAMYAFMEQSRRFCVKHQNPVDLDVDILECFIAEGNTPKGNTMLTKGDWWITIRVNDSDAWEMVRKGELTGFSWEGWKAVSRE